MNPEEDQSEKSTPRRASKLLNMKVLRLKKFLKVHSEESNVLYKKL